MSDADPTSASATRRRVLVFCLFAYGIAAATAFIIYATGGVLDSPALIPGTPITVALLLTASAYMFSPAAAHLLTRLVTREGWSGLGLRPTTHRWWRWILLAWFLPPTLTVLGALLFFAVFPSTIDLTGGALREQLERLGETPPIDLRLLVVIQIASAVLVAPAINTVFAFGEEFGWRAYLQPKLLTLTSPRVAVLVLGLIWGGWHWPLIFMGYQYGSGYWGAPVTGPLLFCVFTIAAGTVLGWLTVRGGSVWPAAVGHGAINASAGLGLLFTTRIPNLLVGPVPIGVLGMVPWVLAAGWLLLRWPEPAALRPARGAGRAT